jgi:hypothetical protein
MQQEQLIFVKATLDKLLGGQNLILGRNKRIFSFPEAHPGSSTVGRPTLSQVSNLISEYYISSTDIKLQQNRRACHSRQSLQDSQHLQLSVHLCWAIDLLMTEQGDCRKPSWIADIVGLCLPLQLAVAKQSLSYSLRWELLSLLESLINCLKWRTAFTLLTSSKYAIENAHCMKHVTCKR